MTPEYGCTCTLFPIDGQTIEYLRLTGRSEQQAALVEAYAKAQGFWGDPDAPQRRYAEVIELDLSTIRPSIAGPSRPHDRIEWHEAKAGFGRICADRGLDRGLRMTASFEGEEYGLGHGALALAAITSCTTATDPAMMVACGLLAQNAVNAGLQAKPWVKRVFAPGSHATRLLLERADLEDALCELGFYNCGYGCMSCIGNSGPLLEGMETLAGHLELASVLSGNRNFEGRISPDISQNYLASPAAVVAYSLAGTIDFDFETQLLGKGKEGEDLFLRDIWPSAADVEDVLTRFCDATLYEQARAGLYRGTQAWQDIRVEPSATFAWDEGSTYVRRAPYFDALSARHPESLQIQGARVLAYLGDFVTTDHISPAGSIAQGSPAASYLKDKGVETALYNTYGARRGNHEAMMRGTFANVRLENRLAQGMHGGITYDAVEKRLTSIFEAAESYRGQGIPLVVLAGKMYGSGSSRDWAAKGPALLGVRAVFAESFERIHRSNLIGMGILPLQFEEGQSAASLGFDGSECITIAEIDFTQGLPSPAHVMVRASREDGTILDFSVMVRIDTPTEGRYFAQGGILPYVLRNLAS
jgi:aconitate hydratase